MAAHKIFPFHSGEVANAIRARDWGDCPIGPFEAWPAPLKAAVQLVLDTTHPAAVWWGPDLIQIYNDSFAQKLGSDLRAKGLGQPAAECWDEIWGEIGPEVQAALVIGASISREGRLIPVVRDGVAEDAWWSYSFGPIKSMDGEGAVLGVLSLCQDVTEEHRKTQKLASLNSTLEVEVKKRAEAERRQKFQLQLGDAMRNLALPEERARAALTMLGTELGLSRAYFTDVEECPAHFSITYEWHRDEMPDALGESGKIEDFGHAVVATLAEGRQFMVGDVLADHRTAQFSQSYMGLGARACLVVPILKQGKLAAAVTLHRSEPCEWDPADAEMIQQVAEQVSNAIEHARSSSRHIEAERALASQRADEARRLRSMFEQAPGFMCVLRGPDHVFEFANESYMALVGNRDLIGRAVRDALPEIEGQAIYEALNAAFASGQPIIAKDTRLTFRPAGEEESIVRYADFVLQPILDESDHVSGIFVEGLDVTDRREAKIALEATQQRLHEGMVAARMSIWDWDLATGKVVFSDTSAEIFGGEWTDLKAVWKFIHPDDMACLNAEREKALAGADAYSTIVRMTPPGSKTIWMKISAKVMRDDAGVAVSIRGVTIDVTERKEAEERLREADRRKDEFLAMLAHELRNPLAPITAGAEILRLMPGDRDRVLRTGAVIERQARHMTAMVSDLLDVSRVTTGRVTLVLSVFDLHTAILESIEQTRSLLDARRQKLTYHAPSGAVSIEADKKRVIQVFTNIIQNAAKFTPERGSITVSLAAMGDQAIAVVEDDGMGIDAELLPRVFDLFTQEKRTSDRSLGGLGIGLSLVKSLVEQQGGLVSAASDGLNRGSTFTVALPLADASEELGYGDTSSTNDSLGAKALRVLVVDDNKDAAESMAILLGREGHAVTVCFHPLEALRLAMDKSGNFDAFVLDIGLPEMDGNELAKRLRAHSSTRNARLIAVTGYSDPKDKAIGLAAGFDHFLVKPVDAKVVFSALAVSGL